MSWEEFESFLSKINSNQIFCESLFFFPNGSGAKLSQSSIFEWAKKRAEENGWEQTRGEIRSFVEGKEYECSVVLYVSGIVLDGISESICLSPEVSLFVPNHFSEQHYVYLKGPHPMQGVAGLATIYKFKPAFDGSYDTVVGPHIAELRQKLEDVALCFPLFSLNSAEGSPLGLQAVGFSIYLPQDLPLSSYSSSLQFFSHGYIFGGRSFSGNDSNTFELIFDNFSRLEEGTKEKIRLSLRALSDSLSEANKRQSTVDLRTAVEIFFGPESNQEISKTVALRCARFSEGSLEPRMELFNLVKGFYKSASAVVHSGKFRKPKRDSGLTIKMQKELSLAVLKFIENHAGEKLDDVFWRKIELS